MGWDLVDREEELARAVDSLRVGRPVAITGPPGVGRSRLLAEIAAAVETPTRPVHRVPASPATRAIPLSPFAALLPAAPPREPAFLLAATVDAITATAGPDGVVLALDDAQHLDPTSLALLTVIAAGSDVGIVLTLGDEPERAPALAALLRAEGVERVELSPLADESIDHLIAAELGPVDPRLGDELRRLSRGSPLVLRELLLGAGPALRRDDDGAWTADGPLVSGRLTDLARERVSDLPPTTAEALELLALAEPVPAGLLAEATSPDTVDGLLAAGLAEAVDGPGEARLRSAAPLYGEVLSAGMGDQRRRARLAHLVAAALDTGSPLDRLRLAEWQLRSGHLVDPELALDGARAALGRQDPQLAEQLVDSLPDGGPLVGLIRAAAVAQQGRARDAEALFAGIDAADSPLVAEVASARAFNLAFGLRRPDLADDVLGAAVAGSADPATAARLESERGVVAGIRGDFATAHDAAERALAHPDADGPTRTSAYVSLTLADAMLGRCDRLAAVAEEAEAAALAHAPALPLARDQILTCVAQSRIFAGEVASSVALCRASLADDSRRLTHWLWNVNLAFAAGVAGDLDAAREAGRSASAQTDLARLLDLEDMVAAMAALSEAQAGREVDLRTLGGVRATRSDPRNTVWLDRALAWGRRVGGDEAGAAEIARRGGRAAIAADHLAWGAIALHDAVRWGRGDEVADVAEDLADVAARMSGAHLISTAAAHARALADLSPDDLLDVAGRFAAHGSALFAAESAAQAATLLAARDDAVGASRAVALSLAWERGCSGASTPALVARPATALTPRVLEIALDAAAGATSAELAERHFLSVRTVDNHLGAAYRALATHGRAGLGEVLAPALPRGRGGVDVRAAARPE